MKANEAPEKLYLHPNHKGEVGVSWLTFPLTNEDVEYIRKDAFIEKAFEFFGEHLWEYIDVRNANCDTLINIDGDKLKEDFGNYVKEE